jgi:hypothetical protein
MRVRLSPAIVVACVALFFSLGGFAIGRSNPAGRAASVSTVTVYGNVVTLCPTSPTPRKCNIQVSGAVCPVGSHVLSGGWDLPGRLARNGQDNYLNNATVWVNAPQKNFAWNVGIQNNDSSPASFRADAVCGY